MNGFNERGVMPHSKYILPKWVIVITVIGLLMAVLGGYSLGSELSHIVSYVTIDDPNGPEDTKLYRLEFDDCIRKYDTKSYYNEFDYSDTFVLNYSSNAPVISSGTYSNDFTGKDLTQLAVKFYNLTYYDVCYVYRNTAGKTTLEYSLKLALESGNMECAIFELDPAYSYETKDEYKVVKDPLEIKRVQSSEDGSVQIYENKIYIIVLAGENATGRYDLSVKLS